MDVVYPGKEKPKEVPISVVPMCMVGILNAFDIKSKIKHLSDAVEIVYHKIFLKATCRPTWEMNRSGKVVPWKKFITDNLLCHKVFSGILILTRQGTCTFCYGELNPLFDKEELRKIKRCFHDQGDLNADVFSIQSSNGRKTAYKVYKRSYCSIYATSTGNMGGLIICNLPYCILIATYLHPIQPDKAVTLVESFCDLLRA